MKEANRMLKQKEANRMHNPPNHREVPGPPSAVAGRVPDERPAERSPPSLADGEGYDLAVLDAVLDT
jgi:hypothetical protein